MDARWLAGGFLTLPVDTFPEYLVPGPRHTYTEPMLSTDNELICHIVLAVMVGSPSGKDAASRAGSCWLGQGPVAPHEIGQTDWTNPTPAGVKEAIGGGVIPPYWVGIQ
jgi:hypothetical protein